MSTFQLLICTISVELKHRKVVNYHCIRTDRTLFEKIKQFSIICLSKSSYEIKHKTSIT